MRTEYEGNVINNNALYEYVLHHPCFSSDFMQKGVKGEPIKCTLDVYLWCF